MVMVMVIRRRVRGRKRRVEKRIRGGFYCFCKEEEGQ